MKASDTILVVDDIESALYSKSQVLRRAGFRVLQATSGEETLTEVAKHHPRLVVLDVQLPDMSGLEVCRRIKSDECTASVIVLQTSATYVREEDVTRALDEGADAALTEPFDPAVLVATVRALLRAREAEDAVRSALAREQEARTAAESINRIKDEFLATLSHELRSPLGAILTWATLLRTGELEPERIERAYEAIERNARQQMKLIADLLEVSRIISGKLVLETHPLRLARVVEDAVDSMRALALEKDIVLSLAIGADPHIHGDESRLQQVISNLLSNSMKFTSTGGRIEVEVTADNSCAVVVVRDTGEGIEPSFLPHIF
ncbi:MAG TPA: hybrid sensor histidine kinase/response regulator, partial [Terriglobales bacterium]|nr:hybrid sensor histidine kinase/response regulator [Terriglobales bacterium]